MPLFQMLSRIPAGLWLRGVGALLLVALMAAAGLALLAGFVAIVLVAVLGFKMRDFFARMFRPRGTAQPPEQPGRRVIEAEYVIVDRRDRQRQ
jgi:hypothetical protein